MATPLKIIIVGDAYCGKTAFINRHMTGDFARNYIATFATSVSHLPATEDGTHVPLSIWDGATESDYKDADGVIIMFDVTRRSTYESLDDWFSKVRNVLPPRVPIVVCGNKVDAPNRVVRPGHIRFHRIHNLQYYDISVRSNYNYDKPFSYLIRNQV